jgi:hypothetical protein
MLSVPWGLTLGPFIPPYLPWPSKIIIEVLEPIVFPSARSVGAGDKTWTQECARRVERTMEDAMLRLEAERVGKPGLRHPEDSSAQGLRRVVRGFLQHQGTSLEELHERFAHLSVRAGRSDRSWSASQTR